MSSKNQMNVFFKYLLKISATGIAALALLVALLALMILYKSL